MRRRQLITALGTTAAAGLAGCATPSTQHPFAGSTVAVRVVSETDTSHDLTEITNRSLRFWEDNSDQYVGFPIAFDLVEADPDVTIRFVDRPDDCHRVPNYSDRVLGCAPVIRPGGRLPRTVRAIVVAGQRPPGKITITTKHELGHILGLGHDDDPQEIMSNDPAIRIPQYALRVEIWETVLASRDLAADATVLFNHGIETWREDDYAGAGTAFRAAKSEYEEAQTQLTGARDRTAEFATDARVETVDLDRLDEHLDRLVERMRLAVEFSAAMAAASDAAGEGDRSTADDQRSTANERITEFTELGSPVLRDVAIALGLVRGFDRDEQVAEEVEDETIDA